MRIARNYNINIISCSYIRIINKSWVVSSNAKARGGFKIELEILRKNEYIII